MTDNEPTNWEVQYMPREWRDDFWQAVPPRRLRWWKRLWRRMWG